MAQLLLPQPGRRSAERFVAKNFATLIDDLVDERAEGSPSIIGGSNAAHEALAAFDVTGFARGADEVTPHRKRTASSLSPYLRYGLLTLNEAWNHVEGGQEDDVERFREHLLWHEYARHWYSRVGAASKRGMVRDVADTVAMWRPAGETNGHYAAGEEPSTEDEMACVEMLSEELVDEGWLVGRSRSWLASYWATSGGSWRDGEAHFFRHLIDGSRGANRLGWQTVAGLGEGRRFQFNRWQVEKWAAGLCASCDLVGACPLEEPQSEPGYVTGRTSLEVRVAADLHRSAGPATPERTAPPDAVWLTAESLGEGDPALRAHPGLPAVFVFDEPLLARLRLSSKRLVFLVETLAELAETRRVELWLGTPADVFSNRQVAVTFAPVPGFRRHAAKIRPAEVHPWPWFYEPTTGSVASFREWRRSVGASSPLSRPAA